MPVDEWRVGERIAGTYDVEAVLGEGGMGVVHRVRHRRWATDLAVKSPLAPGAARERFVDEAETWVRLGPHPHICTCHYVRTLGGVPRAFIEYADAGSLAEWIAGGGLYQGSSPEVMARLLDIAIQVGWGLIHAHGRGVVHQDVKPANILLDRTGTAKITDFGLARAQRPAGFAAAGFGDGRTLRVSSGGMTRAYASPEQYSRSAVGRSSDVWSFAVTLLEMIVGDITWRAGPAAGAVHAALRADGFRHRAAGVEVPGALDDLLTRCLRTDPAERPRMAEVASTLIDLYAAVTGDRYPRSMPRGIDLRADELNNRALSLLDLDRPDEALTVLDEACETDPQHPEAVYNRGLLRWRSGRETDEQLLNELAAVDDNHADPGRAGDLINRIRRERGGDESTETLGRVSSDRPLELTADGRHAWSVGDDKTVIVWTLPAGDRLCTLAGHGDQVSGLAVEAATRRALTTCADGTVRVWNVRDGSCARVLTGHESAAYEACFVPGRETVLSSSADDTVREWDPATGSCRRVLVMDPVEAPPLPSGFVSFGFVRASGNELCLTADRRFLLCSRGGLIWVWDYESGAVVHILAGHLNSVAGLAATPDGNVALSASYDTTVRVWDLTTGRPLRTLPGSGHEVHSVTVTADGGHAVTYDRVARLWELSTGRCLRTVEPAVLAGLVPSEPRILTLTRSGEVFGTGWDASVAAAFQVSRPHDAADLMEADDRVAELVEDARAARAAGDVPRALALLEEARDRPGYERASEVVEAWRGLQSRCEMVGLRGAHQEAQIAEFPEGVEAVTVMPDGASAVTGSGDGRVQQWDLATRRLVRDFGRDQSVVGAVCVTPDGSLTAGVIHRGVLVWDTGSGAERHTLVHPVSVELIVAAPDARRLLSFDRDRNLRVWDLRSGVCERTIPLTVAEVDFHWTTMLCVTADARHAVSAHFDGSLRLWDLDSGFCARVLGAPPAGARLLDDPSEAFISTGCVTGDGRHLVTGGRSGLRVWDLGTGDCVRTLTGHTGTVRSTALTADDRYLLSGADDNTVRVWELSTGRCLRTLPGHTDTVSSVVVTPDARRAVSAGPDGTTRIWELDWDLAVRDLEAWAAELEPYLRVFLVRCASETWTDREFALLRARLDALGYGGVTDEKVRRELERVAQAGDDATILARRADRLAADGRRAAAVEVNERAVAILRGRADAYALGLRLQAQSVWLSGLRRHDAALAASEEAVRCGRAFPVPGRLSQLLSNHYMFLRAAKRRAETREYLREIHEELAESVFAIYLPGVDLSVADPALIATVRDLVSQYERLEGGIPGRAVALSAFARLLIATGQRDQAYVTMPQLVLAWHRWRRLTDHDRGAALAIGWELLDLAEQLGSRLVAAGIRRTLKIPRA